jgi:integrase
MAHAKVHKRSWRDDDRMLNVEVLPKWKSRRATDITRRDVRALLEPIAKRAPVVANRCLALVRGMLNFGLRRDWITANPAALIERPGIERSRDRVLTDAEIALLWTLADMERPTMATLIKLRLLTAQRGGELSQLQWADVEADAFTIPAGIAKNGRAHRVPITGEVRRLLDALPKVAGSPWVFPGRDPKSPMSDAKKAGQRMQDRMTAIARQSDPDASVDFRGHDLRRTAATRMAEAGIPTSHISRVLNHTEKGSRATAVYQRYEYDREKRIALEALEREVLRITAGQAQTGKVAPFAR